MTTPAQHIERRESFRAGNMTAHRYPDGRYRVYSYDTPILSLDPAGRVVFFDFKRYSQTTSTHQNAVLRAIPYATHGHDARVCYEYPKNAGPTAEVPYEGA